MVLAMNQVLCLVAWHFHSSSLDAREVLDLCRKKREMKRADNSFSMVRVFMANDWFRFGSFCE